MYQSPPTPPPAGVGAGSPPPPDPQVGESRNEARSAASLNKRSWPEHQINPDILDFIYYEGDFSTRIWGDKKMS